MKTFTPSQAHALLPILQREMDTLQPTYKALKERYERRAYELDLRIDDPKLREVCMADDEISDLFFKVEESLCFFSELGVECKGIEKGLLDFPCLLEDRIVYLCWKVGESSITHWHEIDAGFAARKPLFEAMRLPVVQEEERLPH